MTSYIVQSALLVLGAYFLGAWIGCACRRILTGRAVEAAASAPPMAVAGSAATAAAADRFGRALTGEGLASRPASAPIPLPETYEPAAPRIETIADRSAPAPAPPQPPRAVSPDAIEVMATPVTPDGGVSAPIATTVAAADDDLALIRGVDTHAADVLRRQGLGSYARIAGMTADEVDRIEGLLDQDGRIGRENWIEQAAMLATGGATHFSRETKGGAPRPVSPHPIAPETTAPETSASETSVPETSALETSADSGTSQRDESVESAATAAAAIGAATAASAASETVEPEPEPEPEPAAPVTVTEEPPAAVEPAPEASSVAAIDVRDDLTRIDGINDEVESVLNQRGIIQLGQIAGWSADDISKVESFLGNPGRIVREDWIGQARDILGLPPVVSAVASAPVEALPVVSPEAAPPSAEPSPPSADDEQPTAGGCREIALGHAGQIGAAAQGDDLKRIRGIGVLIEKKLKSLGVTSYQQIANWTRADIDRISDYLDFRGRIERENWVEQARILVAGGETHFSRRFDQSRTGPMFASNDD